MNVHTRPSHSGMFDKENPPKPSSSSSGSSYGITLFLCASMVVGLGYWVNDSKEPQNQGVSDKGKVEE